MGSHLYGLVAQISTKLPTEKSVQKSAKIRVTSLLLAIKNYKIINWFLVLDNLFSYYTFILNKSDYNNLIIDFSLTRLLTKTSIRRRFFWKRRRSLSVLTPVIIMLYLIPLIIDFTKFNVYILDIHNRGQYLC